MGMDSFNLADNVYYLYLKYSMWNGIVTGTDCRKARLIDIAELRQFATHRSQVFHYLDTVGERFMAGYLIPREFTNTVILQQLKAEHTNFYNMVNHFLDDYKSNLLTYADVQGKRGRDNLEKAPSREEAGKKFSMQFMVLKLAEADVDDATYSSAGGWFNFECTTLFARRHVVERCDAVLGRLDDLKRATRSTAEMLLSLASFLTYKTCFDPDIKPYADKLRDKVTEAVKLYNLPPMVIEARQIIEALKEQLHKTMAALPDNVSDK